MPSNAARWLTFCGPRKQSRLEFSPRSSTPSRPHSSSRAGLFGGPRTAHENLARGAGFDSVKGVVTCLAQADYGRPIDPVLRVFAKEQRSMHMSEAERKAASLPPKLTVRNYSRLCDVVLGSEVLISFVHNPGAR
jgi:hypothetical protein